jgi:PEGA domain
MKSFLLALFATAIIGFSTGCVSERTSFASLPVSSTPFGATVRTNGVTVGLTPTHVTLPRLAGKKGNEVTVSLELSGYQAQDFVMKSSPSWEGSAFLLQRFPVSFIFGKSAVEPGSALDLVPKQIDAVLIPLRPVGQAR